MLNLTGDTTWLSGANEFNDPFDSSYSVSPRSLIDALDAGLILNALKTTGIRADLDASDLDAIAESEAPLDSLFAAIMKRDSSIAASEHPKMLNVLKEALAHVLHESISRSTANNQRAIKVGCFTERNDSILMWSHYADYHRGFSLEYDLKEPAAKQLALHLWPVIYSNALFDASEHYQRMIGSRDFNNLLAMVAALHKASEWQYETEWRLVAPLGESHPSFNMSMPTPKRIYLGARILPEKRAEVLAIAKSRGIAVSAMRLDAHAFGLNPEPCDL